MPGLPDSPMPESVAAPGQWPEAAAAYADWSDLVQRIRSEESGAMDELYGLFSKGIRFYLYRQFGPQNLEDGVHDAFLEVVQAIRRGDVREPERLMGYVRTVVLRRVAARIQSVVDARRNYTELDLGVSPRDLHPSPEHDRIPGERVELAMRVLAGLPKRDREILRRFYLEEQSPYQICSEMSLTETQFRLIKSRAKARFSSALGETGLHRRRGHDESADLRSLEIRRLLPVVAHAVAVFGDESKASHWLTTRLPFLGDRSPSQLLGADEGLALVEQTLTRIEYNIPS